MNDRGKLRAGRRKVPSLTTSGRPRALDELCWAVVRLSNAVSLLGQAFDEGPLRTAILREVAAALEQTKSATELARTRHEGKGNAVRASVTGSGEDRMERVETQPDGDVELVVADEDIPF